MGELVFIGLGLDGEKGITLRGLDEARSADLVFAELYTSALPGASLEAVEKLIDRKIRRLTRQEGEDGQVLLAAAAKGEVPVLVPGDPLTATTHVDLRLRLCAAAEAVRSELPHMRPEPRGVTRGACVRGPHRRTRGPRPGAAAP